MGVYNVHFAIVALHDINSLIDRWNEHEDEVKRELIYDAMQEEGNDYESARRSVVK